VETPVEISVRHTGRLDVSQLEHLAAREAEIHGECGWRRWELPIFAEYGRNYVLEVDGVFAGSAQLIRDWDKPGLVYLAGFGLVPDNQGQGIGARFLKMLLAELAKQDVEAVELTAAPDNAAALKIYNDAGFRAVETHTGKYGAGNDRLIMRLNLKETT
jgi:ribosomal protein S18 acetylase RimI-like enzyme